MDAIDMERDKSVNFNQVPFLGMWSIIEKSNKNPIHSKQIAQSLDRGNNHCIDNQFASSDLDRVVRFIRTPTSLSNALIKQIILLKFRIVEKTQSSNIKYLAQLSFFETVSLVLLNKNNYQSYKSSHSQTNTRVFT